MSYFPGLWQLILCMALFTSEASRKIDSGLYTVIMAEGGSSSTSKVWGQPLGTGTSLRVTGMEGGTAGVVNAVGVLHGNIVTNDHLHNLEEKTREEIDMWTDEVISVSVVDKVIDRFKNGQKWISIIGNAGEGKTTVGYMTLKELQKSNKRVFKVDTPEDYYHISRMKGDKTILMNDILGTFTFFQSALNSWMRVIQSILDEHDKSKDPTNQTYVIFICRKDVLEAAKNKLERYKEKIFDKRGLFDLGKAYDPQERLNILEFYLNMKSIAIDDDVKKRVASANTPHGFPHCCKIYSDLVTDGPRVDIEIFFKSPLRFLDGTTKVLIEDGYMDLFMNMIKTDGELNVLSISDDKIRRDINKAASRLEGSYIRRISGMLTFSHASVYESVISVIGEQDSLSIIKHASLSVLLQKVNIKEDDDHSLFGFVNLDPDPEVLDALCERFKQSVLEKDFSIFSHRFCDNRDFCERLVRCCIQKDTPSEVEDKEKLDINEIDSEGSTMLHSAAKGGRNNAVSVLTEHGADVNLTVESNGMTPLNYLCSSGKEDVSTVQLLLTKGADLNKAGVDGWTAVSNLCLFGKGDLQTIQLLIKKGAVPGVDKNQWKSLHHLCGSGKANAYTIQLWMTPDTDVNQVDDNGLTALHHLCYAGNADVSNMQVLITPETDVNKPDKAGWTALHYLCANGGKDIQAIELLINHGADIEKADMIGGTALQLLCLSGKANFDALEMLITQGADVNMTNKSGFTALHNLCLSGAANVRNIQLLLTPGTDVNQTEETGMTALHKLCESGRADVTTLEILIERGADGNIIDNSGRTALNYLYESSKSDISSIQLLITHTDVNITDKDGLTALHWLCYSGKADLSTIQLLVNEGTDVNKPDRYGRTALHYLYESTRSDTSTVQLLIIRGTDVNQVDNDGRTALHNLCFSGRPDASTLLLLIKRGSDINKVDQNGRTALHHLCASGKADIGTVKLLIQNGALINKVDGNGKTALQILCDCDDADSSTVELLYKHTSKGAE